MTKVVLRQEAIDDLNDIWDYTYEKWSEKQADFYYQMLLDNCKEIAENTAIGKKYEEILELIYGYKAGRHIIFYRILNLEEVEITRILHEQMDLKNRMQK